MAGAGISYKIEYLRINRTCPASTCGIFHTLYEPKFQVALTHRNWTGGLLPVNASSYILGASIQPLAWLCVGCSGLVKVYQACAVFLMWIKTDGSHTWTGLKHMWGYVNWIKTAGSHTCKHTWSEFTKEDVSDSSWLYLHRGAISGRQVILVFNCFQ